MAFSSKSYTCLVDDFVYILGVKPILPKGIYHALSGDQTVSKIHRIHQI